MGVWGWEGSPAGNCGEVWGEYEWVAGASGSGPVGAPSGVEVLEIEVVLSGRMGVVLGTGSRVGRVSLVRCRRRSGSAVELREWICGLVL